MKRLVLPLLLFSSVAYGQTLARTYTQTSDRGATPSLLSFYNPVDGKTYVLNGDPNDFAIPVTGTFTVTSGPVQFTRNGVDQEVTLDTATAANNRPLPTTLLAGDSLGPVAVGNGATSSTTLRTAANLAVSGGNVSAANPVPVSSGTGAVFDVTNSSNSMATETTSTLIATRINNLNSTTSGLLTDTQLRASAVPVSLASVPLPTGAATETTLAGVKTRLDVVDFGAGTTAQRVASVVGNATGIADFNLGATGAQTQRVSANVAFAGTAASVNSGANDAGTQRVAANLMIAGTGVNSGLGATGSATLRVDANNSFSGVAAATGVGASSTGTQRVVLANESQPTVGSAAVQLTSASVRPYLQKFASVNLTTSYTQVVASTPAAINSCIATNNSSEPIYIATGAAASEVAQFIISPGENTGRIPIQIASATRISIRADTNTITDGTFVLNCFQ